MRTLQEIILRSRCHFALKNLLISEADEQSSMLCIDEFKKIIKQTFLLPIFLRTLQELSVASLDNSNDSIQDKELHHLSFEGNRVYIRETQSKYWHHYEGHILCNNFLSLLTIPRAELPVPRTQKTSFTGYLHIKLIHPISRGSQLMKLRSKKIDGIISILSPLLVKLGTMFLNGEEGIGQDFEAAYQVFNFVITIYPPQKADFYSYGEVGLAALMLAHAYCAKHCLLHDNEKGARYHGNSASEYLNTLYYMRLPEIDPEPILTLGEDFPFFTPLNGKEFAIRTTRPILGFLLYQLISTKYKQGLHEKDGQGRNLLMQYLDQDSRKDIIQLIGMKYHSTSISIETKPYFVEQDVLNLLTYLLNEVPGKLDVNERDLNGETLLHYVAKQIRCNYIAEEIITLLCQHGAIINLPVNDGTTSFFAAFSNPGKYLISRPWSPGEDDITNLEEVTFSIAELLESH